MTLNELVVTVEATHQALGQRLDDATGQALSRSRAREDYARTDAFLAATCRHLAAVEEALVPVARHRLPEGRERARGYLHQARLVELATARVKARLYGEVHALQLSWSDLWDDVRRELDRHNEAEMRIVEDLSGELDRAECDRLAERLYRAEVMAPTRAHPYLPHTGPVGHLARRLWAVADRFWDAVEGRVMPQPVRPPSRAHSHDSLMGQYLFGGALLDADAPMFARRHQRAERGNPGRPGRRTAPRGATAKHPGGG
jgi:hypothetical protein